MKEELRAFILNLGADVCGFAAMDRFDQSPPGFHPRDSFPACRTAVVFGIALPRALAEVEPRIIYGHFNEHPLAEADRIAFQAAREVERRFGGRSLPMPSDAPYECWDAEKLEGRGLLSMRHAAAAAGLGTLGKNTLLLNSRFGNFLTLGCVLTDLELPSDPPAESICIEDCGLCIRSCPSGALTAQGVNQRKCREHTYGVNARGFHVVNCNLCRVRCPRRFGLET